MNFVKANPTTLSALQYSSVFPTIPNIITHTIRALLPLHPFLKYHLPKLPHLVDLQPPPAILVALQFQHHDIGIRARLQRPLDALQPQHARRRRRDGPHSLRHARAAPVEEISHALDELDAGARNLAVGALEREQRARLHDPRPVGPVIGPVGQADQRHGVGDQDAAVRVRVPRDLDGRRVQVDAVGDEAEERLLCGVGARRCAGGRGRGCAEQPEDARVAVVQRAHCVEQVRDCGRAGGDARARFFVRCFRVPDRDCDVQRCQRGDAGQRAGQLGREG